MSISQVSPCRLAVLLLKVAYPQDGRAWTVGLSPMPSLPPPLLQLQLLSGMGMKLPHPLKCIFVPVYLYRPVGVFEMDKFAEGSRSVLEAIVAATEKGATSIIGIGPFEIGSKLTCYCHRWWGYSDMR